VTEPVSRRGPGRDALSITAITAGEGLSNILMPLLLADAGYSAATIGPLMAVLGVAALASRFPVGALYRPSRARWLLVVSLVVAAGCSLLYPHAVASAPLFVAVRVLDGLASGTATTVNLAFFIDSQPAGVSRARAMGLYGGGMAAGFTLGNLIGGVAGDLLGYAGAFAVGALFWIVGLCQALVRPTRPATIPEASAARTRTTDASGPRGIVAMLRALRDPTVVEVTMISFQLNAIHHIGGVFFPLIARVAGLGLSEIGLVRSLYSLVNAVTRPLSAPLIARFGAGRASFLSFALQAAAIACIPFVGFGGLAAFLVVFALSGGGRAVGFTANAIALAEDIPESRLSRGLSSSLFNAAKDVGNIAGPIIGSALISLVGLELMFVTAPALLMLMQVAVTGSARRAARQAPTAA
jgi:MFS family permease